VSLDSLVRMLVALQSCAYRWLVVLSCSQGGLLGLGTASHYTSPLSYVAG
jgi:hypothetical protein